MKKIVFLLCILVSSLTFSQNINKIYKKKEFSNKIDRFNILLTKKETIQDSIVKGEIYLKYYLSKHIDYKTKIIRKIEMETYTNIEYVKEIYYFDEDGFLMYVYIEQYKYTALVGIFEIKLYGKDRISYVINGVPVFFNKKSSDTIIKNIKTDIDFYKEQF
jgi:hypothetical protein